MKKTLKFFLILLISMAFLYFPIYSQSKDYGAIQGNVKTESGEVVVGADIKLSSPNLIGGEQETISDERGKYRFVALPPGTYALTVTQDGFSTAKKTDVRLSVGRTITVDFSMELGKVTETVEVRGVPALIDVKDSQTAKTHMSKEFIQNLPVARNVEDLVGLAPGVNFDPVDGRPVAHGGANNAVMFQVDGVKINNPEGGVVDLNIDFNTVEEVSVMGVGAPAEFDGFSGAIMNTVTKSGGNEFSGVFDFYGGLKEWKSDNTDDEDLTETFEDHYRVHGSLGGPVVKDKLWFYSALEYEKSLGEIESYLNEESNPGLKDTGEGFKFFGKLTWQPNKKNRFSGFFQWMKTKDKNGNLGPFTSPEAAMGHSQNYKTYNFSWLHIFSDFTFMELKYSGFKMLTLDIPSNPPTPADQPMHEDDVTGEATGNYFGPWDAYRDRNQVNVSVSHHADDFLGGSHDFKFGVEWEHSPSRTVAGYAGVDEFGVPAFYIDYEGENYIKVTWTGYDFELTNKRIAAYVQDSWSIGERFVINLGVRLNNWRGALKGEGNVFKPKMGIAPRFGITYDLFGDHSTAIKAHYGKYYHGMVNFVYSPLGDKGNIVEYIWGGFLNEWAEEEFDETGEWPDDYPYPDEFVEDWSQDWNPNMYYIDDNIKMPYMNQFTVGVEREIIEDFSIGLTYVYRSNHDMIDTVLTNGEFESREFLDPENSSNYTVWDYISDPDEHVYRIYNPKAGDYDGLVGYTPSRKYSGIELMIEKRFSKKWQIQASYVYSKAWGTDTNIHDWENNSSLGQSYAFSDNRNQQLNADGRLDSDPTHMIKIMGSVLLPLDISLGFFYSYSTGMPYARRLRTDAEALTDRVDIKTTPIGEYRLPNIHNLDLRLEKIFKIGNVKLGALLDIRNLFNSDTTTRVVDLVNPSAEREFGDVDGIVSPRVFRLGFRIIF